MTSGQQRAVREIRVVIADDHAVVRDGLRALGLAVAPGDGIALVRTLVRVHDAAHRLGDAAFQDALRELPSLRPLLGRLTHALLLALAQTTSCGRAHRVDECLATLVLRLCDEAGVERPPLTHEHLAALLGTTRRASVTESAHVPRASGAMGYRRGRLYLRDRARLAEHACRCHLAIGEQFAWVTASASAWSGTMR